MRSVLILGSGRSGTSMITGTLAKAGYFMGESLYPPASSNPKGFFEDPAINGINEEILRPVVPRRLPVVGRWIHRNRPHRWSQFWLAQVPLDVEFRVGRETLDRIERATQRVPFCFKDPRFSYTLPVWRPYLKDTVFVCVFRSPAETVASMIRECATRRYLRSVEIGHEDGFQIWCLMYEHILERHRFEGAWLFMHYQQAFSQEGLDRLARHTEAEVDRAFPEPSLHRSKGSIAVPERARHLYRRLCELAEYRSEV